MALSAMSAFRCNASANKTMYAALSCPNSSWVCGDSFCGIKSRTVPKTFRGTLPLKSLKSNFRPSRALGTVRVVAQSDFADHEASRFREGLLKMLADDENIGELRIAMVDTCTKIFRQFAMSYKGELPIDPFVEMRHTLEGQGIPLSKVGKVTRGALGWSRYNLYRDWKNWSTSN